MKNKYKFSIDKDFKTYAYKQFFLYLVICFMVFVLFYFTYDIILAGLILWLMFVFFVLILYIDLKLSYNFYIQKKQIENLEYIISFLEKGGKN